MAPTPEKAALEAHEPPAEAAAEPAPAAAAPAAQPVLLLPVALGGTAGGGPASGGAKEQRQQRRPLAHLVANRSGPTGLLR